MFLFLDGWFSGVPNIRLESRFTLSYTQSFTTVMGMLSVDFVRGTGNVNKLILKDYEFTRCTVSCNYQKGACVAGVPALAEQVFFPKWSGKRVEVPTGAGS